MRKNLVFGSVADRGYEGQLTFGDRVTVNEVSAITVNAYTKRTDITYQEPDAAAKTLYVDQQYYAAYDIEDIETTQSQGDPIAALNSEMAYALSDNVDQFLAGLYGDAGSSVTANTVTAGNVLVNIANHMQTLNEAYVPSGEMKFLVVAPWFHAYALQAATGIVGHTGVPKLMSDGAVINGFLGELFGMNILVSNNVNNNGTVWNNVSLTRRAMALVMQIEKVERMRRENRFSDGLRSLIVYGGKVMRPMAMVSHAATKG